MLQAAKKIQKGIQALLETFPRQMDLQWSVSIWPQQQLVARETHDSRRIEVNQTTVEERLIVGEQDGSDKYSYEATDRSDWEIIDRRALMIHRIKAVNTKSASGLFYITSLSDKDAISAI